MRSRLTTYIFIGMLLGIGVGYLCSITWPDPQTAKEIAGYIALISDVFLRLIKMIIAPLVFSTLVVGIAHLGDTASVGRVGGKALLWFVGASLCSLLLGLVMVNILRPGDNLNLPLPDAGATTNLKAASLSLKEFVIHLVPKSPVEAMANNEILQIVVFSVFFGVALAAIGEKGKPLAVGIESLADVMLKITGYVMNFAPVAVFAAIAATITTQGIGVIVTYAKFMLEFYFSLAMLWCLLVLAGFVLVGGGGIRRLLDLIKEPFVLAFSTASSEAAYPKTLANLERFGV
ncbi:MAG TPA: dicarboxylate/amino acid:cation symporter, partial [Methylobacterium sp.]|nr:dicarboxylate/amino acid:cation symporter [Methylobacterium sp.]